jgi:hypothetical protein
MGNDIVGDKAMECSGVPEVEQPDIEPAAVKVL